MKDDIPQALEPSVVDRAMTEVLKRKEAGREFISREELLELLEIPDLDYSLPPHEHEKQRNDRSLLLLRRKKELCDGLLEEHNVHLATLRGRGLRIVPPNRQAAHAVATAFATIEKTLRDSVKVATHTDMLQLTASERSAHSENLAHLGAMRHVFNQQKQLTGSALVDHLLEDQRDEDNEGDE